MVGRQDVGAVGRGHGGWAPALPALSSPTPSAASLVCCGSGASRLLVSFRVPLSVALPLIPAPLPALPPSLGPPSAALTAGWGPHAGRWQAGLSSPFPGAAATCLIIACIPCPPPRRKASWREGSRPSAAVHQAGSGVRGPRVLLTPRRELGGRVERVQSPCSVLSVMCLGVPPQPGTPTLPGLAVGGSPAPLLTEDS